MRPKVQPSPKQHWGHQSINAPKADATADGDALRQRKIPPVVPVSRQRPRRHSFSGAITDAAAVPEADSKIIGRKAPPAVPPNRLSKDSSSISRPITNVPPLRQHPGRHSFSGAITEAATVADGEPNNIGWRTPPVAPPLRLSKDSSSVNRPVTNVPPLRQHPDCPSVSGPITSAAAVLEEDCKNIGRRIPPVIPPLRLPEDQNRTNGPMACVLPPRQHPDRHSINGPITVTAAVSEGNHLGSTIVRRTPPVVPPLRLPKDPNSTNRSTPSVPPPRLHPGRHSVNGPITVIAAVPEVDSKSIGKRTPPVVPPLDLPNGSSSINRSEAIVPPPRQEPRRHSFNGPITGTAAVLEGDSKSISKRMPPVVPPLRLPKDRSSINGPLGGLTADSDASPTPDQSRVKSLIKKFGQASVDGPLRPTAKPRSRSLGGSAHSHGAAPKPLPPWRSGVTQSRVPHAAVATRQDSASTGATHQYAAPVTAFLRGSLVKITHTQGNASRGSLAKVTRTQGNASRGSLAKVTRTQGNASRSMTNPLRAVHPNKSSTLPGPRSTPGAVVQLPGGTDVHEPAGSKLHQTGHADHELAAPKPHLPFSSQTPQGGYSQQSPRGSDALTSSQHGTPFSSIPPSTGCTVRVLTPTPGFDRNRRYKDLSPDHGEELGFRAPGNQNVATYSEGGDCYFADQSPHPGENLPQQGTQVSDLSAYVDQSEDPRDSMEGSLQAKSTGCMVPARPAHQQAKPTAEVDRTLRGSQASVAIAPIAPDQHCCLPSPQHCLPCIQSAPLPLITIAPVACHGVATPTECWGTLACIDTSQGGGPLQVIDPVACYGGETPTGCMRNPASSDASEGGGLQQVIAPVASHGDETPTECWGTLTCIDTSQGRGLLQVTDPVACYGGDTPTGCMRTPTSVDAFQGDGLLQVMVMDGACDQGETPTGCMRTPASVDASQGDGLLQVMVMDGACDHGASPTLPMPPSLAVQLSYASGVSSISSSHLVCPRPWSSAGAPIIDPVRWSSAMLSSPEQTIHQSSVFNQSNSMGQGSSSKVGPLRGSIDMSVAATIPALQGSCASSTSSSRECFLLKPPQQFPISVLQATTLVVQGSYPSCTRQLRLVHHLKRKLLTQASSTITNFCIAGNYSCTTRQLPQLYKADTPAEQGRYSSGTRQLRLVYHHLQRKLLTQASSTISHFCQADNYPCTTRQLPQLYKAATPAVQGSCTSSTSSSRDSFLLKPPQQFPFSVLQATSHAVHGSYPAATTPTVQGSYPCTTRQLPQWYKAAAPCPPAPPETASYSSLLNNFLFLLMQAATPAVRGSCASSTNSSRDSCLLKPPSIVVDMMGSEGGRLSANDIVLLGSVHSWVWSPGHLSLAQSMRTSASGSAPRHAYHRASDSGYRRGGSLAPSDVLVHRASYAGSDSVLRHSSLGSLPDPQQTSVTRALDAAMEGCATATGGADILPKVQPGSFWGPVTTTGAMAACGTRHSAKSEGRPPSGSGMWPGLQSGSGSGMWPGPPSGPGHRPPSGPGHMPPPGSGLGDLPQAQPWGLGHRPVHCHDVHELSALARSPAYASWAGPLQSESSPVHKRARRTWDVGDTVPMRNLDVCLSSIIRESHATSVCMSDEAMHGAVTCDDVDDEVCSRLSDNQPPSKRLHKSAVNEVATEAKGVHAPLTNDEVVDTMTSELLQDELGEVAQGGLALPEGKPKEEAHVTRSAAGDELGKVAQGGPAPPGGRSEKEAQDTTPASTSMARRSEGIDLVISAHAKTPARASKARSSEGVDLVISAHTKTPARASKARSSEGGDLVISAHAKTPACASEARSSEEAGGEVCLVLFGDKQPLGEEEALTISEAKEGDQATHPPTTTNPTPTHITVEPVTPCYTIGQVHGGRQPSPRVSLATLEQGPAVGSTYVARSSGGSSRGSGNEGSSKALVTPLILDSTEQGPAVGSSYVARSSGGSSRGSGSEGSSKALVTSLILDSTEQGPAVGRSYASRSSGGSSRSSGSGSRSLVASLIQSLESASNPPSPASKGRFPPTTSLVSSIVLTLSNSKRGSLEADAGPKQLSVQADAVLKQWCYKADTFSNQPSGDADTISKCLSYGADTVPKPLSLQAGAVLKQRSYKAETVLNRPSGDAETISKRLSYGADTGSKQLSVQADTVSNQLSYQAETDSKQPSDDADTISKRLSYGTDTVPKQLSVQADTVSKRPSDDAVSKQLSYEADTVSKHLSVDASAGSRICALGADDEDCAAVLAISTAANNTAGSQSMLAATANAGAGSNVPDLPSPLTSSASKGDAGLVATANAGASSSIYHSPSPFTSSASKGDAGLVATANAGAGSNVPDLPSPLTSSASKGDAGLVATANAGAGSCVYHLPSPFTSSVFKGDAGLVATANAGAGSNVPDLPSPLTSSASKGDAGLVATANAGAGSNVPDLPSPFTGSASNGDAGLVATANAGAGSCVYHLPSPFTSSASKGDAGLVATANAGAGSNVPDLPSPLTSSASKGDAGLVATANAGAGSNVPDLPSPFTGSASNGDAGLVATANAGAGSCVYHLPSPFTGSASKGDAGLVPGTVSNMDGSVVIVTGPEEHESYGRQTKLASKSPVSYRRSSMEAAVVIAPGAEQHKSNEQRTKPASESPDSYRRSSMEAAVVIATRAEDLVCDEPQAKRAKSKGAKAKPKHAKSKAESKCAKSKAKAKRANKSTSRSSCANMDVPLPVSNMDAPATVSNMDVPVPVSNVDVPVSVSNFDVTLPVSSLDVPVTALNMDVPVSDLNMDGPVHRSAGGPDLSSNSSLTTGAAAGPDLSPNRSPTTHGLGGPDISTNSSLTTEAAAGTDLSPNSSPTTGAAGGPDISTNSSLTTEAAGGTDLSPNSSPTTGAAGGPDLSTNSDPTAQGAGEPCISPITSPTAQGAGGPDLSPNSSPTTQAAGGHDLSPDTCPPLLISCMHDLQTTLGSAARQSKPGRTPMGSPEHLSKRQALDGSTCGMPAQESVESVGVRQVTHRNAADFKRGLQDNLSQRLEMVRGAYVGAIGKAFQSANDSSTPTKLPQGDIHKAFQSVGDSPTHSKLPSHQYTSHCSPDHPKAFGSVTLDSMPTGNTDADLPPVTKLTWLKGFTSVDHRSITENIPSALETSNTDADLAQPGESPPTDADLVWLSRVQTLGLTNLPRTFGISAPGRLKSRLQPGESPITCVDTGVAGGALVAPGQGSNALSETGEVCGALGAPRQGSNALSPPHSVLAASPTQAGDASLGECFALRQEMLPPRARHAPAPSPFTHAVSRRHVKKVCKTLGISVRAPIAAHTGTLDRYGEASCLDGANHTCAGVLDPSGDPGPVEEACHVDHSAATGLTDYPGAADFCDPAAADILDYPGAANFHDPSAANFHDYPAAADFCDPVAADFHDNLGAAGHCDHPDSPGASDPPHQQAATEVVPPSLAKTTGAKSTSPDPAGAVSAGAGGNPTPSGFASLRSSGASAVSLRASASSGWASARSNFTAASSMSAALSRGSAPPPASSVCWATPASDWTGSDRSSPQQQLTLPSPDQANALDPGPPLMSMLSPRLLPAGQPAGTATETAAKARRHLDITALSLSLSNLPELGTSKGQSKETDLTQHSNSNELGHIAYGATEFCRTHCTATELSHSDCTATEFCRTDCTAAELSHSDCTPAEPSHPSCALSVSEASTGMNAGGSTGPSALSHPSMYPPPASYPSVCSHPLTDGWLWMADSDSEPEQEVQGADDDADDKEELAAVEEEELTRGKKELMKAAEEEKGELAWGRQETAEGSRAREPRVAGSGCTAYSFIGSDFGSDEFMSSSKVLDYLSLPLAPPW
eukprot:gene25951-11632_t